MTRSIATSSAIFFIGHGNIAQFAYSQKRHSLGCNINVCAVCKSKAKTGVGSKYLLFFIVENGVRFEWH